MQAMLQRQAIEDFLAAGNSLLNLQASSSDEIGRAGQEARRLVGQLGDVSQVRACLGLCCPLLPCFASPCLILHFN
jgi:hypothetical protein